MNKIYVFLAVMLLLVLTLLSHQLQGPRAVIRAVPVTPQFNQVSSAPPTPSARPRVYYHRMPRTIPPIDGWVRRPHPTSPNAAPADRASSR